MHHAQVHTWHAPADIVSLRNKYIYIVGTVRLIISMHACTHARTKQSDGRAVVQGADSHEKRERRKSKGPERTRGNCVAGCMGETEGDGGSESPPGSFAFASWGWGIHLHAPVRWQDLSVIGSKHPSRPASAHATFPCPCHRLPPRDTPALFRWIVFPTSRLQQAWIPHAGHPASVYNLSLKTNSCYFFTNWLKYLRCVFFIKKIV